LEKEKQLAESLTAFLREVSSKPLNDVLNALIKSENKTLRRFAVFVCGATDNLQILGDVLTTSKNADLWDAAVMMLRHWIGRGPGQDQILYNRLIEIRHYKPAEAATVLHFLHTPDEIEESRPETYEMLIEFLGSERVSVRGLAYWHLYRLVPAGRK